MRRIVLRAGARADLREAIRRYESHRAGLGDRLLDEVDVVLGKIAQAPERFPTIREPDVRRALTRRFPYAIHFRVRGETIVVLAVFHGRRDPDTSTD